MSMGDGEDILKIVFMGFVVWGLGSLFGWWGPSNVDKLRSALQDANSEIDSCNQQIYDAKNFAWQDYETMGNALDGLTGCNDVADPTK